MIKFNTLKLINKVLTPVTIIKYSNGKRIMRILDPKTRMPVEIRELK